MDAGKPKSQSLAIAYAMKRKAEKHKASGGEMKMADGGFIGSHQSPTQGHSIQIHVHPQGEYDPMGKESGGPGHVTPNPVHEMNAQGPEHEEDMVDRIMKKRMPKDEPVYMSEGGMMANEDSGESTSDPDSYAKADPNEFDYLAKNDDLEFSDTASNSGDELGSKLNQDDEDEDMVGRIMKKRSMK